MTACRKVYFPHGVGQAERNFFHYVMPNVHKEGMPISIGNRAYPLCRKFKSKTSVSNNSLLSTQSNSEDERRPDTTLEQPCQPPRVHNYGIPIPNHPHERTQLHPRYS